MNLLGVKLPDQELGSDDEDNRQNATLQSQTAAHERPTSFMRTPKRRIPDATALSSASAETRVITKASEVPRSISPERRLTLRKKDQNKGMMHKIDRVRVTADPLTYSSYSALRCQGCKHIVEQYECADTEKKRSYCHAQEEE